MSGKLTRRKFLATSAGAMTVGSHGCLGSNSGRLNDQDGVTCALPAPECAPFDTVVVLMMEDRSFDHMLGWLPGANGRQYAGGRCDGFLKTRTDRALPAELFPIGYYGHSDLPILATLATGYTTFYNYFSSMQGPT